MSSSFGDRSQRILVIGNDPAMHHEFRKILDAQNAGFAGEQTCLTGSIGFPQGRTYEIHPASQSEEGVRMVQQALEAGHPYAVAFIDEGVETAGDGLETTRRLWKLCPDLQVVICTAHSDHSWSEIQARINPLDRLLFLRKPFDSVEVLQLTHALTEKWRVLQDFWEIINNLDEVVKERTQALQESESAALGMRDEAMLNKQKVEKAYEELKREMEERKELQERFRNQASLLDKARDAIIVCNLQHRVSYWNKSATRLYHWTAGEAIGRTIPELMCKDITVYSRAFAELVKNGEWVGELQQTRKDGQQLTVEARWTLVSDAHDEPGILAIYTDVTGQRQLEQQFLRAQRMESIGTLAGGIAHDLNNMLTPITMSVDLLKHRMEDQGCLDILDTIASSTRRGAEMIKQVLTFARGMEGCRVQVEIKHLVKDITKMCQDTFPKHIQTQAIYDESLWTLKGDPTQLHQVLLNLCVNARDAMPHGGQLVVTAQNVTLDAAFAAQNHEAAAGPHVLLQVQDAGTGMPKDMVEKIFDPFFTTKEAGKGTGLGLSTTLSIVKNHGGFIRVESEPQKGTRFCVYLPAQPEARNPGPLMDIPLIPRGHGETVLVVDDEESVRQVTRKTLEMYDYRVLQACDGVEALNIYTRHTDKDSISAVLMDMMMPQMDGAATIAVLKRMNPSLCIIATSGVGDFATKASALGVPRFIAKPFASDALLSELADALHGKS
jgi:PAS domain S-box-containing protein